MRSVPVHKMENNVSNQIVKEVTKPVLGIDLKRIEIDADVTNPKKPDRAVKPEMRPGNQFLKCDDDNLSAKREKSPPSINSVSNTGRYCRKLCPMADDLTEHEISHTVNEELKCPDCVEHACMHRGKKSYKCDYCNKGFTLRCNLVRHVRIHTSEKPFACSICKKSFILKKNMIEHWHAHTGEKPFECSHCDFAFSRRSSLLRHSRIHTGENIFKCHMCHESFSWKHYLRRHMSTHLKNEFTMVNRRTGEHAEVFIDEVATTTDSETELIDLNSCPVNDLEIINNDEEEPQEEKNETSQEMDTIDPICETKTVELPNRTSNLCSLNGGVRAEEIESDESVEELCEIIKFKMTKSEFDNFCNRRLLIRLRRVEQQTPIEMCEE